MLTNYFTSLCYRLEATGNTTGSLNTDVIESRWTEELGQLRELTDDTLKVADLAVGPYTTDAFSLLERFLQLWPTAPEGLPVGLLSPEAAAIREQLVGFVAMEIFLARFGVSVGPPPSSLDQERSASAAPGLGISGSLQMTGLPSPTATPSSSRASSAVPRRQPSSSSLEKGKYKGKGRAMEQDDEADGDAHEQQPQDDAALRLSRYAASIGSVPGRPDGAETALLSRWPAEPGTDPAEFEWSRESARLAHRSEAGKRARQARQQRRMERRAALGLSVEPDSADQHSDAVAAGPPRIGSSQQIGRAAATAIRPGGTKQQHRPQTQVMGGHALSSQAAPMQSSQIGETGGGSLRATGGGIMIMSQPVGGRHGVRLGAAGKKKKGGKSGFR